MYLRIVSLFVAVDGRNLEFYVNSAKSVDKNEAVWDYEGAALYTYKYLRRNNNNDGGMAFNNTPTILRVGKARYVDLYYGNIST